MHENANAVCSGTGPRSKFSSLGIVREPIEEVLNGRLGLVLWSSDGHRAAVSFVVAAGRISRIDAVRNPDKLRHLRSS